MKLFDDFIQGTIPQATFAKHLQETSMDVLESLHELEDGILDTANSDGKKKKKKPRRKKKSKKKEDGSQDEETVATTTIISAEDDTVELSEAQKYQEDHLVEEFQHRLQAHSRVIVDQDKVRNYLFQQQAKGLSHKLQRQFKLRPNLEDEWLGKVKAKLHSKS